MKREQALIQFLQQEQGIAPHEISLAVRSSRARFELLHIVLWQYGLLSMQQLEQVLDWLER